MNAIFAILLIAGSPAIGLSSLFAGLGGKTILLRRQKPLMFILLLVLLGFGAVSPSLLIGRYLGELPACLSLLIFSIFVGRIARSFCFGLVKTTLRLPDER